MPIPRDIKPCAYRGVRFEALDVGETTGRRIIVDEYPQRDTPNTGDIGRKVRRWRLAAFLVRTSGETWDDLQARKRELINACNTKGAATLVHPTDGDLKVRCETCDVTQQAQSLDYIEFALEFVEAGVPFVASASSGAKATNYATALRTVTRAAYAARRGFVGMSDRVRTLLSGSLIDKADAVFALAGTTSGADVTDFRDTVAAIRSAEAQMLDDAEAHADAWQQAFTDLADPESPRNLLPSLVNATIDSQAAIADAINDDETAAFGNAAALDYMVATACASVACDLAASADYAAYDDAIAARDALADNLDTLLGYASDTDTYAALMDLQAAMSAAITEEAVDLPRLRSLTVNGRRTALALAWQLYGDPDRADEIVDRNAIADPNAVTGTIQVLTE
jgi:prophage DNA circulation protein